MMGLFTSDLDSENNPRPYPSPFQVVATVGNCNDNILVLLLCNFFQNLNGCRPAVEIGRLS